MVQTYKDFASTEYLDDEQIGCLMNAYLRDFDVTKNVDEGEAPRSSMFVKDKGVCIIEKPVAQSEPVTILSKQRIAGISCKELTYGFIVRIAENQYIGLLLKFEFANHYGACTNNMQPKEIQIIDSDYKSGLFGKLSLSIQQKNKAESIKMIVDQICSHFDVINFKKIVKHTQFLHASNAYENSDCAVFNLMRAIKGDFLNKYDMNMLSNSVSLRKFHQKLMRVAYKESIQKNCNELSMCKEAMRSYREEITRNFRHQF